MPLASELGIVSVLDFLTERLGLQGEERGNEYYVLCVNPKHMDSRIGNCSINLETGLWSCFSCGKGGDLVTLASYVWTIPWADAKERLSPASPDALLASLQVRMDRLNQPVKQQVLPPPVPAEQFSLGPYDELEERGFERQTLVDAGVRYVPTTVVQGSRGPFNIYASYGIPIRDTKGTLRAWCFRRTEASPDWQPRYLYDRPISAYWYGMDRAARERAVVVTEGALDSLACWQQGFPAVAMLGASMGQAKAGQLRRFDEVTLLGDRDAGGVLAVRTLGTFLEGKTALYVARYARWMVGKDAAALHGVDLEIVIANRISWQEYALGAQLRTKAVTG
jgi:hypothetical protein